MLRLAKAFWDLAFWRISPEELPASWFLLLLVTAAVALLELVGALLPGAPTDSLLTHIALSVALGVAVPLLWAWSILALMQRGQRFLQTASALLGVGVLAELLMYPLGSILNVLGTDSPAAIPLGLLSFAGLVWYVLACANIWKAALEAGLFLGIAISVGYLALSYALQRLLLPDN